MARIRYKSPDKEAIRKAVYEATREFPDTPETDAFRKQLIDKTVNESHKRSFLWNLVLIPLQILLLVLIMMALSTPVGFVCAVIFLAIILIYCLVK